jgi:N-acetylmuramic acid 6-phosphate etherase
MIKTGKSFGNLMVDVKASNKKLYVRAIRIVMQATECTAERAELALEKSKYNAKVAILHVLTGVDIATAKLALSKHKGFLRKAINALENIG